MEIGFEMDDEFCHGADWYQEVEELIEKVGQFLKEDWYLMRFVEKSYLVTRFGHYQKKDVSSERDSSELKGDESLFAYLMGFGMSKLIESEKRMKLRR